MTNILEYLDSEIEKFKQTHGKYPSKILLNNEALNKIKQELNLEPELNNSWADTIDNYRGLAIEITNDIVITLQ